MQRSEKHMELLAALGMQQHLTASMILLCAKHLYTQTPEAGDCTGNDEALMNLEDLEDDEEDEDEEEAPDIAPAAPKTIAPPKRGKDKEEEKAGDKRKADDED